METCPQCGRTAVTEGVCGFCGWRDMNTAQATDALTEAVCRHSLQARMQRRKARIIVATAAKYAPTRERIALWGEADSKEMLATEIKADIARNGTIVIGVVGSLLLFPILLQVLISVIARLIVRWIVNDREMYGLIQQARGQ